MHGRFVLYLHEFRISLGHLLMFGMKVTLKINIPSHAFSGFLSLSVSLNLCSSLRVWLVTLPNQSLTRPCLADHVLGPC